MARLESRIFLLLVEGALLILGPIPDAISAEMPSGQVVLLATQGEVEVMRAGARTWDVATTNLEHRVLHSGDQLRAQRNSHATVRLSDGFVMRIGPEAHLQVLEPLPREVTVLSVIKGWFFFLHREEPGRVRIRTATVTAAIEGTEFNLQVAETDGTTRLDLFDGKITMSNTAGQLVLTNGQAGVTRPGEAPAPVPKLEAVNVIQWNLYYPGVLHVEELSLPEPVQALLQDSIRAYRRGNLVRALAEYPPNRTPDSADETVYLVALLLGVGHVEEALKSLDSLPSNVAETRTERLAAALRLLIAAVKFQERPSAQNSPPSTSTEWLAESYYLQSRANEDPSNLKAARDAARQAVSLAPNFAFALTRLAELEFSFGRLAVAEQKLEAGLVLGSENAQAVALQGFVLAARGRINQALAAFDRSIALDSGLANAWLGRGLCRIRHGQVAEGREDLLVAVATEPQRAVLRSYLGKAFTETRQHALARHELELAKGLDPNDPTAWLYSALLNQLDNRINRAVDELEHSQALNNNRSVYRSRQLLDQDRAVRGVNLANIYNDAGLTEVAFREAIHAVHDDYANFSTHLFLANSFNNLRDPRQVNLRYETPWLSEYLVANLLAPVQAGALSQLVSTEEYARLFERNRLGLVSTTEYLSNGDWLQAGSQYGRLSNWSYALEEFYRSQNGFRPNEDFEHLTLSFQSKFQLTLQDELFVQAIYYDASGGDLAQHYSATNVNRRFRFEENQEPILFGGYHHAWAPDSHTLLMVARLDDTVTITNPVPSVVGFGVDGSDRITDAALIARNYLPLHYQSELEIYSAELQHIWQWRNCVTILGGRYQTGEFDTANAMPAFIFIPQTADRFETSMERTSLYGYQHWQPVTPLRLIAGVSYDRVSFPENFRSPPISGGRQTEDQVSPKAGLMWTPGGGTMLRGAYARSLGGVSIDQSFQLEPSQVAGFVQTFRSLFPESVAGPVSAPTHETFGLALDQKFPTRTYLGISGEWLEAEATREVGVFRLPLFSPAIRSTTPEELDFREQTLRVSLNQLVGDEWTFGAVYRWSRAELWDTFTEIPVELDPDFLFGGFVRHAHLEATLQQVHLLAAWNLPSGFFARFDSIFSTQHNAEDSAGLADDAFWQFNLFAGYRFLQRRAELSVGLLNLTDQDYQLNPLNLTPELPRERTVALRLRVAF